MRSTHQHHTIREGLDGEILDGEVGPVIDEPNYGFCGHFDPPKLQEIGPQWYDLRANLLCLSQHLVDQGYSAQRIHEFWAKPWHFHSEWERMPQEKILQSRGMGS